MSLAGRILNTVLAPWRGASTLANPQTWFREWSIGNSSGVPGGGVHVNEVTAMNYLAVFSCVSLIAGAISGLPLQVFRKTKDGREQAEDHPADYVLGTQFNENMSALTGREAGLGHLLTWGNSYTQILTTRGGDLVGLHPLPPDVVKPRRSGSDEAPGPIVYDVYNRKTGRVVETLPAGEVLHVPGLGYDGLVGYSPVSLAKTSIRAGIGQDAEAEKFISRGVRPPGALKLPPNKKFATAQEAAEFRTRWEAIHQGDGQKILILEEGREWQALGIDPVDAQLLESRKFSRLEIAGLFRVPPFMIGDQEKNTSWGTGIEEQGISFVKYTLMNWIRRIEAEYNRKLFERGSGYYCKHNVEALLRGDILKRSQALEIQHRRGIRTDNEWRELEDLNPVEGGNVRHFPLQEGRVDEDGNDIPAPANPNKPATVVNDNPPAKPKPDDAPKESDK